MAKLEIRIFGDPVLRQEAREVTEFDERLQRLAGDMLETMRAAEGVGLAANQVGILKRLFTWEIAPEDAEPQGGAVVNPVVEETSEEAEEADEGCLSFPGLLYPLERPFRARVRFQEVTGEERTVNLEGYVARVFLHEIDHLNGVLFIDHLAQHDRNEAMRLMREFRMGGVEEPTQPAESAGGSLLGRRGRRL